MIEHLRINYIHYGDFLESGYDYINSLGNTLSVSKDSMLKQPNLSRFSKDVLRTYGPKRSRQIDIDALHKDILHSNAMRTRFKKVKTRGFSYRFVSGFDFAYDLCKDVDLRFALLFGDDLFYPPKVRRYLQRKFDCHLPGKVALAFALGRKLDSAWVITTMQSDLVFGKPSYVRDHLRGWQRVLFSEIEALARISNIKRLILSSAHDQPRCCHPKFKTKTKHPLSWELIYDDTARYFGLVKQATKFEVNIQVLAELPPVYSNELYERILI